MKCSRDDLHIQTLLTECYFAKVGEKGQIIPLMLHEVPHRRRGSQKILLILRKCHLTQRAS